MLQIFQNSCTQRAYKTSSGSNIESETYYQEILDSAFASQRALDSINIAFSKIHQHPMTDDKKEQKKEDYMTLNCKNFP